MKKHNEGYTLPLVMVVLLVLAIVAVTIMTTSLKNMQRQQGFIETMKAQYAAQAVIEEIVGRITFAEGEDETESVKTILQDYSDIISDVSDVSKIKIISSVGTVSIHCELELTINENAPNKITYTSYEIIKGGAAQ
jgi:type II secretory pathway pseudopilin PulG